MAQGEVNKSKMVVSALKRVKNNHPTLPRGKAPRSLSSLTQALTKAGYDPSKIEERAILLAKAAGAKRKRDEEEEEGMEVDEEDEEDWEDDSEMEVDEDTPRKKLRTEKGSRVVAVDRRARTDRSLAGLGGPEVRLICGDMENRVLSVMSLPGYCQSSQDVCHASQEVPKNWEKERSGYSHSGSQSTWSQ